MSEEDKHFIKRYEELLDKGYCDCNEMNCIDNNSPRRILKIVKELYKEIERLTAESTKWESKFYDEAKKVDKAIEFIIKNENNISSIKDLENDKTYNSALLYVKSILQESDKE